MIFLVVYRLSSCGARLSSSCQASQVATCQCRRHKRHRFDPWVQKIPWRSARQSTPGESHGQRSLVGYSPWGRKELDSTEATSGARTHARGSWSELDPSSQTRNQTHVPCSALWILNHWTTREVPSNILKVAGYSPNHSWSSCLISLRITLPF